MTFGSGNDFTALAAAALLIGISKGGLGGPLPTMLATLMLTQRGSVATAVALATPLLMVGDAFAMYTYWGKWDREHSRALIPGGVVGVLIGFLIGVLPATGATIASFIAYIVEKKLSKHPEQFGKGAIEGVAGPEASNNAAASGALVPMLSLGVPG